MSPSDTPARRLRELIARPGALRTLAPHDTLTAILLERAGFEMLFLGGFGVSASLLGLPDLGFVGASEMASAARRITLRVSIPLIVDGDTGGGDVHNVARCVREIEASGAAGVILEDQVFPKRCGHFEGKGVIPAEDMTLKIKAAAGARRDPDFVVVARTDAREPHGLDEAIDRVNRYCDAGADVAFVEAPRSIEELEAICRRVSFPKLANMLPFGKTPIVEASRLEAMGYKFVVAPIDTLLLAARGLSELAGTFLREGHTLGYQERMMPFDDFKRLLGVEDYLGLRQNLLSR